MDERLVGRRHRYGYAVAGGGGKSAGALLRHDLEGQTVQSRSFGEGREPNEFVFEPAAPDAAEGDGLLMGFVYDAAARRSDLMLLDAGTLETVAAVHLPARVPHGFHGNWVPAG